MKIKFSTISLHFGKQMLRNISIFNIATNQVSLIANSDSVMLYDRVGLKYGCEAYFNPWSLWSCNSTVTFSFLFAALIVFRTRFIFRTVGVL